MITATRMSLVWRCRDIMATGSDSRENKSLPSLTGQASLEYFILFAIIACLTILSFSSFLPKVKEAIQGTSSKEGFFQKAAKGITE